MILIMKVVFAYVLLILFYHQLYLSFLNYKIVQCIGIYKLSNLIVDKNKLETSVSYANQSKSSFTNYGFDLGDLVVAVAASSA